MRILVAVHGFPPTENGGAERRASRTASGLASRGHTVTVLVSPPGIDGEVQRCTREGLDVWRSEWSYARHDLPFAHSYDRPDRRRFFDDAIAAVRPDVVHVFSGYGSTAAAVRAAAAASIPVVVSLTDFWWLCERITLVRSDGTRCDGPSPSACGRCHGEMQRRYRWLARFAPPLANALWHAAVRPGRPGHAHLDDQRERMQALRDALGLASAIVAPSAYVAGFHERYGVDAARLVVARQGVVAPAVRPRRGPDPALHVGYMGQVKPHKGVDLLLSAWERLEGGRPRRLTLWGDASGEEEYADAVRRHLARLPHASWAEEVSGPAVWESLAALDVVVLPSRWAENSPNIVLEAQELGVPVVGARIGGVPELVRHEDNGLLFEPDSVDDLTRQLQRLLDDRALLAALASRAVRPRSFEDELDELEAIYARVAARPHAPGAASPSTR